MGFIDFTNGEVLTADQMDLVMRQGIMRFANATARDTALSAVLAEGMMAYLDDTNEVLKYDGTDWIDISGDITGVTAGTALTGGGTSGNVTLDVDESALTIAQSQVTDLTTDLADKQDDVITTEGDLVIGDASGDPVRLPVGSADQVLTSDGTTISFQDAGGGGGGENFYILPYEELAVIDVDFQIGDIVRFAIITTTTSPFTIFLKDASGNQVDSVTVDRDNPFSYYATSATVAKIDSYQEVINEDVILVFSNPRATESANVKDTFVITNTQSITLASDFTAFCIGGGGAGGGVGVAGAAGGGGGSGFFATGTLSSGTYTATIGAGGSGDDGDGQNGGTTSIGSVSALGGNGGIKSNSLKIGGDGGNGGSGGGGGVGADAFSSAIGGAGGVDGGNGGSGSFANGTPGSGGTGSQVQTSTTQLNLFQPTPNQAESSFNDVDGGGFYAGGAGGAVLGSPKEGGNALGFGGGGTGASQDNDDGFSRSGGDGFQGYILLVEV